MSNEPCRPHGRGRGLSRIAMACNKPRFGRAPKMDDGESNLSGVLPETRPRVLSGQAMATFECQFAGGEITQKQTSVTSVTCPSRGGEHALGRREVDNLPSANCPEDSTCPSHHDAGFQAQSDSSVAMNSLGGDSSGTRSDGDSTLNKSAPRSEHVRASYSANSLLAHQSQDSRPDPAWPTSHQVCLDGSHVRGQSCASAFQNSREDATSIGTNDFLSESNFEEVESKFQDDSRMELWRAADDSVCAVEASHMQDCAVEASHMQDCAVEASHMQDLDGLKILLDRLDGLGIEAKPKLFTRLGEEPQLSGFVSAFHNDDALNRRVDLGRVSDVGQIDKERIIYCKNLFLKDRKGQFYVVMADENCCVGLKQLKTQLNASRNLSFADEQSLEDVLGLKQGEVTPFALMHQSAQSVRVAFHESLSFLQESQSRLALHPLSRFLQVEILFSELVLFIDSCGKKLEILSEITASLDTERVSRNLCVNKHDQLDRSKRKDKKREDLKTKCTQKQVVQMSNGFRETASVNREATSSTIKALPEEAKETEEEKSSCTGSGNADRDVVGIGEAKPLDCAAESESVIQTQVFKKIRRQNLKGVGKGKLKSYLKENSSVENSNVVPGSHKVAATEMRTKIVGDFFAERKELIINSPDKIEEKIDLYKLCPKKDLPEIDEFYDTLNRCGIGFQEIPMSHASSQDNGPSLGVKCFLFEDGCQNYFLVVCHEFYEPDYGRLKLSLRPKQRFEVCSEYSLPRVLGVDCHHFTPFAAMNSRARQNGVRVFFTEKIVLPNILFCIQHPFAPGYRLIMMSSDLQRLIGQFSPDGIGVVEEKPWPKRYNLVFSRYEHEDFSHSLRLVKGGRKFARESDHVSNVNNKEVRETGNGRNILPKVMRHVPFSNWINFRSCFDVITNLTRYCKDIFMEDSQINDKKFIGLGSQVDAGDSEKPAETTGKTRDCDSDEDKCQFEPGTEPEHLIPAVSNSDMSPSSKVDQIHETRMAFDEDHFDLMIPNEEEEIDSGKKDSSQTEVPQESAKAFLIGTFVTTDMIRRHLAEVGIHYSLRTGEQTECSGESGDERLRQACYTQHLYDDVGQVHYVLVGRDVEHIAVRRFARRFSLSCHLSVISDANSLMPSDRSDKARSKVTVTNPFSVFLSMCSGEGRAGFMCNIVLYSSIYMDPTMTCVFEVDPSGVSVCMLSQEFERYCQLVGMDVWRMP